ncbi:class I SAM-dependent methyltransferase [Geotoga petraea]|jgi:ubiquinone/menaquinone biosynthesis C-methylase UbiE|uniref:Class I SAM-dependent methyltransferase n=1 Tax=Geotoga petraea TaxID=28234 RepID=A0A4Z0VY65_9BACT|nr:class I SAM-dependent methyltransferase [Geotoga petraea]TGG86764.1 class I SAM-dependent methyltransferase [Geotoga petraea]
MFFDKHAEKWDSKRRIERAKIISKEIIKSVEIKDNFKAMDFGGGTGLITFNLYDKLKNIILVDASNKMIEVVKEKINQFNIKNVKPIQVKLDEEKIDENDFDIIISSMALHHVVNLQKTIDELYKYLKKDGQICIVELLKGEETFHQNEENFKGHDGFKQEQLKEYLKKAGFKNIESRIFYTGKKENPEKKIEYNLFIMTAKK